MLATLDVPYADTKAEELVWSLGHPLVPALATLVVPLPRQDATVELRVLGASHQAVLRTAEGALVETVACLPAGGPYLPARVERRVRGRGYRFTASVRRVTAAAIRDTAGDLLARAGRQESGAAPVVAAAFAADPGAVTALALRTDVDGIRWETWHVYPNSQEIVTTGTEIGP